MSGSSGEAFHVPPHNTVVRMGIFLVEHSAEFSESAPVNVFIIYLVALAGGGVSPYSNIFFLKHLLGRFPFFVYPTAHTLAAFFMYLGELARRDMPRG
jgi:hypothetical protein